MTFKADPRMRAAIEKLAKKHSISMAAVIKQAIEEHLKEHGIDWREEEGER